MNASPVYMQAVLEPSFVYALSTVYGRATVRDTSTNEWEIPPYPQQPTGKTVALSGMYVHYQATSLAMQKTVPSLP